MVHHINEALRQIQQDLAKYLEPAAIFKLCRAARYRWRQRVLDPVTTIHLFVLQILHGNTACSHLPHLAKKRFTPSAYCQARARLPLKVFQKLLNNVGQALQAVTDRAELWLGHRVFLLDGSGFSMPDTAELQKKFGQPGAQKPGCGFPVAHMLLLFHAGTGLLRQVLTAPLRTHDMSQVAAMHPELGEADILLGDRGFCSYAHLALIFQRKLHAVLRVHQKQIVDFRPHRPHQVPGQGKTRAGVPRSRWLRRLGMNDQLVEWFKPVDRPGWMSAEQYAALPQTLVLRELRYRVAPPGFRTREITLVTTLLEAKRYSADRLADLYRLRWRVETNLSHLKRTMKMDVLHCESVAGVMKELTMFALVYNLVRVVMWEAARRQQKEVDRISFVDALRWLCTAQPGEPLPELVVNPARPNRIEPRVRKRRAKEYPLMHKPRGEWRKELLGEAIRP
jgi:hypothetical protein